MLVVSDGSTDRTADVARDAGVYVAVLPFNLGIGGALRTGFAFAVRHGYERAVQFDADGQHDPLAVRVLLDGLDDGADMVIGSPVRRGRRRHLRGQRHAPPGDEVPAVAGAACSSASGSPTPARASARSRARCSSTSR